MKEKNGKIPCPCCSGKIYVDCCRPFHEGQLPNSALQLMRSRYSAYALGISTYIIDTTHPANLQFSSETVKWSQEITEFCLNTKFQKLEILDFKENDQTATVTFIAYLVQGHQDISFMEKSDFEKVEGKWLYRGGQLSKPA